MIRRYRHYILYSWFSRYYFLPPTYYNNAMYTRMLHNTRAENIGGIVAGNLLCSMHFPRKYLLLYNIYNSYKCFCLQRNECCSNSAWSCAEMLVVKQFQTLPYNVICAPSEPHPSTFATTSSYNAVHNILLLYYYYKYCTYILYTYIQKYDNYSII